MTDHPIRFFTDDAGIARVGEGLLARTLARDDWTHEAHLAAVLWLIRTRTALDLDAALPGIIRGYNEAVGGVNDDHHGYHHTITCCFLAGAREHHVLTAGLPLVEAVNTLLASPAGRRDLPLRFYSRERLFSVAARRGFVAPDLAPFPVLAD